MAILRSADGKFYDIPDADLAQYEIPADQVKGMLAEGGGPGPGPGPGPPQGGGSVRPYQHCGFRNCGFRNCGFRNCGFRNCS